MRTSSLRILAATTVAAGAAATAALAAGGLTTAGAAATPQTLTFQEPRPSLAENDIPPRSKEKLSLGDSLAISGALESADRRRLGTFGGTCTAIGAGRSFVTTPLLCHAVYTLPAGQIEAVGEMTLSRTNLAVIGGTGAFAGADGTVTPGRVVKGFDDADQITIDG
jgi:hypothetical protein